MLFDTGDQLHDIMSGNKALVTGFYDGKVLLKDSKVGSVTGNIRFINEQIEQGFITVIKAGSVNPSQINPHMGCSHEWKTDSFFSSRIYETCTKCGCKKEDL